MLRAAAVLLLLPLALRADDEKEARALLRRAIAALGGEKALSRPHALAGRSMGTLHAGGKTEAVANRFLVQGLDKLRWEAEAGSSAFVLGLDGSKGWISGNGGKAADLPKEHAEALRRGLLALRIAETLVPLAKGWKLSHLGEMEVDGTPCVGLKATRKGQPAIDLHFDKKTLLPRKVEIRLTKPGESAETALAGLLSGYKKIGGRLRFTKLTVEQDGTKLLEMERKEVKQTDEADAATFERP